jgi:hypothetical protein
MKTRPANTTKKTIPVKRARGLLVISFAKDRSGMKYRGLKTALKCGPEKIDTYLEKALVGDYPLLSAGE